MKILSLAFLLSAVLCCEAFLASAPSRATGLSRIASELSPTASKPMHTPGLCRREEYSPTRLDMLPALARTAIANVAATRLTTKLLLLVTATLFVLFRQRSQLLWPNSAGDASYAQPLPPGSLGCPFFGMPFFWGSREYGAGAFYLKQASKLPAAARKLWKFYFLGNPFVVVAGADNVKTILNKEFEPNGIRTATRQQSSSTSLGAAASIISEQDKGRHQFLRRLIGQAITPAAVAKSIGTLQQAAEESVAKMLAAAQDSTLSNRIVMEDICTDFTLDVAWRQILGLDLTPEQVPVFHKAVADWIGGVVSLRALLGLNVEKTPSFKAKKYLESLVEQQIDKLKANGPDASTLSGMVFAKDEENPTRTLSQGEIIDNALILILAGSETSATTLTNAMLFLGLHRETWNRLVEEQRRVQAVHGEVLTKEALDKECPYLEAVVKETMRIRPISGGIPRRATSTIVMDGKQIPKDWLVDFNVALTHQLDAKTYKEDGSNMDIRKGFVPDRWLSPETTPAEFIPMGADETTAVRKSTNSSFLTFPLFCQSRHKHGVSNKVAIPGVELLLPPWLRVSALGWN